jgi:DHA1 family bicyclomycin/chloramphenicol resistance-like MFS transporter
MGALPVLVLGLLAALGPLSIDLYLPAFPELRQDLHTSAAAVQFTLAGMTLGLALGQAVVGTWSDRVGRRTPLLLSTALHLVATAGCALAPSVEILAACRVVQGIGAAGSAVLVLAIVRDVAEGRSMVVLLSRVTLVETVAPLLAPVAGAELLPLVGWRGIFGVLAAGSATLLVAALLVVPETVRVSRPVHLRTRLRAVRSDRDFRLATVSGSMTFAGVYAYVAASPTLLQEVYGLSARAYAVVFLLNSLGLVAGVQAGSVLTRRAGPARVLAGCTTVTLVAAAAIVPLQEAHAGLAGLLPCLWLFVAGCGGCFACAAALALHGQGAQSGTATSVYGFATFAVAGLVAPLAGLAGITDATPVAVVLLATSAVSLAATGRLLRGRRTQPVGRGLARRSAARVRRRRSRCPR